MMPSENSPSPKRVLVTYATAGAGHKRAAMALREAMEQHEDAFDVRCIDVLDYCSDFFKRSYPKTYLTLVQKISWLWGFGYAALDHPWVWPVVAPSRRIWNCSMASRFLQYLRKEQPDVVVATHFMSADLVGYAKKRGWINSRLIVVTTDMHPHRIWLTPETDAFVVSNERGFRVCGERGINSHRVHILGIPVSQSFTAGRDDAELRSKWNVGESDRVVLIISGGTTVGQFEAMVRSCLDQSEGLENPPRLFVVCGENQAVAERLKRTASAFSGRVDILGFINKVDELMAMADLVIAKAGGLLVTEALVSHTPLILYHAIPGQEAYNAAYVSGDGAAVIENRPAYVGRLMRELLDDSAKLEAMQVAAAQTARPGSAAAITEQLIR